MFRNWVLENFPFLEDDFDALTDYELFCKICGYVIGYSKDNEEMKKQIEEFQHYFDNLDVQEEINNKLDEMAIDGTLDEIINQEIFGELNSQVQSIQEELNNIEVLITTEMVVFGDSWSDPEVEEAIWPESVADELRLNLHNYAKNGAGYVSPSNNLIETQLNTAINDTSYNKNLVKYVVFSGGINDYRLSVTLADLRTAIRTLYNASKLIFPNAKIIYVNNFQYPYTKDQSEYWYKLQYNLSSYGINVLNQDGFFTKDFFLDNLFHITTAGQLLYGSNIITALSGGQIKNNGVYIDFEDDKGYMYIRRDDNILNYYMLFENLISTDVNIPTTQELCWPTVFDSQLLGGINSSYTPALTDFDDANQQIKIARQDTSVDKICFNGSLSLNIRL